MEPGRSRGAISAGKTGSNPFDTANENRFIERNLRTTSYLDRRYYTASYSEAARYLLGTESPSIRHRKDT